MKNKSLLNLAMNILNAYEVIYVLGFIFGYVTLCYYIAKVSRYFVIGG